MVLPMALHFLDNARHDGVYIALFRPSSCARKPRASADDAVSPIGSQSASLIAQRDVASLFDESLVLTYTICLCVRFGKSLCVFTHFCGGKGSKEFYDCKFY